MRLARAIETALSRIRIVVFMVLGFSGSFPWPLLCYVIREPRGSRSDESPRADIETGTVAFTCVAADTAASTQILFSASDDGALPSKLVGRKTDVTCKIHTAARNSHSPGR